MGLESTSTDCFEEVSNHPDYAEEAYAKSCSLQDHGFSDCSSSDQPRIAHLITSLLDYDQFSVLHTFFSGCHKALSELCMGCDYDADEQFGPIFINAVRGHYNLEGFMDHLQSVVRGMPDEHRRREEKKSWRLNTVYCVVLCRCRSMLANEWSNQADDG